MSEVKRYMESWGEGGGVVEHRNGDLVSIKDFNRVTTERDVALAENKVLSHNLDSHLETVVKLCDMLGVDLEAAKMAEGKPSDVLFGYISSMQQRLTVTNERYVDLERMFTQLRDGQ